MSQLASSQFYLNKAAVLTKDVGKELHTGDKIELGEVSKNDLGEVRINILKDEKNFNLLYTDLRSSLQIEDAKTMSDYWKNIAIRKGTYYNLLLLENFNKVRIRQEEENLTFLTFLRGKNLIMKDAYLEDYLTIQLNKIYPFGLNDNRKGNLNIQVIINPTPNCYALSNGTILISTGLLSLIKNEDELLAVLGHEIAHYVLDHQLFITLKLAQMADRAKFWSDFLTTTALITDIELSNSNLDQYYPGSLTSYVYYTTRMISAEVIEHLGLKYSREQEKEADATAVEILNVLKIPPSTLSNVLLKIKYYQISVGEYCIQCDDQTHPSMDERISNISKPLEGHSDKNYDQHISKVLSFNASLEFENKHYATADSILNRLLACNMQGSNDLLIKARIILEKYNSEEKVKEAISYLESAVKIKSANDIFIYKYLALAQLRLNNKQDALKYLGAYQNDFIGFQNQVCSKSSCEDFSEELKWIAEMTLKVNRL